MHKTAINYALKYRFRLGTESHGYYVLYDIGGRIADMSYHMTAKSGIFYRFINYRAD